MLWRSVVGKLWITILLLVSVVLGFVAVLLLQFFENYYLSMSETRLKNVATQISQMIEEGGEEQTIEAVGYRFVDPLSRIMVVRDEANISYSPGEKELASLSLSDLQKDKELNQVFTKQQKVQKRMYIPGAKAEESNEIMIVGVPLGAGSHGGVFVYQSLQVPKQAMKKATDFIFLSAGIAIMLTTFFAFFLSTRITAPLRKMREVAFDVARGRFDVKVPMVSRDEIGELGTALNQMGRQLKFNINALEQEKEQLTSILSSMADGVITLDQDGQAVVINPPAERFLQLWHVKGERETGSLPAEVMQLFHRVVESEQEQAMELNVESGSYVILMTPLYNQTKIRGAVAVLRDMTEERRLEKMRKDFIANVSHELRTPMVMLQGYSEAILDDLVTTKEEVHEFVQIIYDESVRLGRLVNELLDLARMESGHVELHQTEVELGPFVDKIIRKFQGITKEKEIRLYAQFGSTAEVYTFDPDRLEQVLTNLIDNGVRHTEAGGSVTLAVDSRSGGLVFEVQDSGIGIPEEDIPFVFERFYKGDKARTRNSTSGTGLGLAIAKNIVQSHGGRISVSSVPGKGTTFSVFLPA
ncbi:ATP-binding protein [Ectobacillus ponti]|uniref:histidine kinase n=1 Tax=Ectobacillus ponti TaxID=2961894 RepID=A0AA41X8M7_9BACI|nr:ATP-binding protein [Ectobacillus ponti]MCP8968719.1 cell wall metabolism sensor histidine kinase WalK [Ectobacillus ponti]